MQSEKREHPKEKSNLHPRNRHRERYDFKQLIATMPELAAYVHLNAYQDESIDFFDPEAVKMLNKALLKHFYAIDYWDIPLHYLCPPIPGRADYIHHIAEFLGSRNKGKIPEGERIKCLDIGVGANCVYPIIGNREYKWSFAGSDIDAVAIESAIKITENNPGLKSAIDIRLQTDKNDFFKTIIRAEERFDLTICNPPFHASQAEAQAGTIRKLSNLRSKRIKQPVLNFGGQQAELWCEGGEVKFVCNLIYQSRQFSASCFCFSSLISKEASLNAVYHALKQVEAFEIHTIPMGQGNKKSRIVVWTFLNPEQQQRWIKERW
ncbi:MAG: 23S rRNA (adenine(1618)-N(6))-methyltransferase RlmF [Bacteroidetes bacterium]|nr:23S rRNA (adenine(1618)-N(6))-methyltransferase RlmF [Bacteroidota bacterium]